MKSRHAQTPPAPTPEVMAAIVAVIDEYLSAEAGREAADGFGRPLAWRISLGPTPAPEPEPRRYGKPSVWAAAGRRDLMDARQKTYDRKGFGR